MKHDAQDPTTGIALGLCFSKPGSGNNSLRLVNNGEYVF